jgi:NAD(P)-dependent dehydrogenase (short-subunit alcohol dehydrogenase family)
VNGALNALALTLAKELAPRRVNAVSPGLTRTPAYDYMGEAERKTYFERMGASLPVGRVAQPEEIADAVRFVVSNQFVTGTVLDVDGGVRLG